MCRINVLVEKKEILFDNGKVAYKDSPSRPYYAIFPTMKYDTIKEYPENG